MCFTHIHSPSFPPNSLQIHVFILFPWPTELVLFINTWMCGHPLEQSPRAGLPGSGHSPKGKQPFLPQEPSTAGSFCVL